MNQYKSDKPDQQQRNMQFLDDRLELLETIREMINTELDRRSKGCMPREPSADSPKDWAHNAYPENQPPSLKPKESACRRLWHRIAALFSFL